MNRTSINGSFRSKYQGLAYSPNSISGGHPVKTYLICIAYRYEVISTKYDKNMIHVAE